MLCRLLKRDDGQVSLSVILLSLIILAAGIGAFVFGEAADARSRAQKSADAAALAAARDTRDTLIEMYTHGHVPTPPRPILTPWETHILVANQSGRAGASDYASRNASSVTSYVPAGYRITVDTASNETPVESPVGKKVRKSLSSPATATAELDKSGMFCTVVNVVIVKGVIVEWSMKCTRKGRTAHAHYVAPLLTMPVALDKDSWRRLFDIRLVD